MITLLGKNITELTDIALSVGLPKYAGKQLAHWLYVKRAVSFDEMTNLSLTGREALKKKYQVGRYAPIAEAHSQDGTCKYLFEIKSDGTKKETYIETVYLPETDRATLCVSTQAGCRMGCKFCMTGTLGFQQHLTAADILNQIFTVDDLHGRSLTNIVYMGEGEPLDNVREVLQSLTVLTSDWGCSWSPHRITVSTVGFNLGLTTFLDGCDCHLAISLHNPFPAERAQIMPAQRAYPIEQTLEILKRYDFSSQRRLSFEYICFGGKNDSLLYAQQLVKLLQGLPCRVNLIRFHQGNMSNHNLPASDEQQMIYFRDYLSEHGVICTIRRSRGEDILAACGMLVNDLKKK